MSCEILNVGEAFKVKAAGILGVAFKSDPLFTWLSEDQTYPQFAFSNVLPSFSPHGHMYMSKEENGAAIWLPPGIAFPVSAGVHIIWRHFRDFGVGTAIRFIKMLSMMDKYHYKPPHYYLFAIGVTGDAQGKGVGSELMKTVTMKCDDEKCQLISRTQRRKIWIFTRVTALKL